MSLRLVIMVAILATIVAGCAGHRPQAMEITVAVKQQARVAVNSAIKAGKLTRQPCIVCGNPKTQAHHYLGYAKEHWMDIQWLCKEHHKK